MFETFPEAFSRRVGNSFPGAPFAKGLPQD
jgi:hypothetical protein